MADLFRWDCALRVMCVVSNCALFYERVESLNAGYVPFQIGCDK